MIFQTSSDIDKQAFLSDKRDDVKYVMPISLTKL